MSRRPIWQTVFERFDPERPAETDAPAWRADRPQSPTDAIVTALDRPFGTPRVILTGTIGTGKTTELLRISEKRAAKEFVVFLNLERHFHEVVQDPAALQNVSAWEVCFLAGVALLRSAEERLGFTFPEVHLRDLERAWVALARSSKTVETVPEVDVAKLAKAMVLVASTAAPLALGPVGAAATAGLAALGAVTDAGKWSLPFGRKKERAVLDQDPEVQSLVRCVNVLLGLVRQRAGRVLLVLDGLDRIEEFDRAKELFIDSQVIGELDCRVVLCGPFVLRRHGAILNVRGFSDVPPLVSVPVLDQRDPSRPGPGIPFFHTIFERRTADLGAEPPPIWIAATLPRRLRMVLPAPAAHDEVPPAEAGWIDGIRLGLRLSGAGGILVHVDRAVPERLGDLVRGLVGEHPEIDVHTELGAVETVAEGSVMVLILRPEHAEALNLGRPIFERRRLKVVLWCDHETTLALMDHAPDFFDWVSGHYECPPAGPVAHAVAGLKAAIAANARGILWRGSGDQDDKRRLWSAFESAFPEQKLTWIEPTRPYEDLLGAVRGAGDEWIACHARAASHVRRFRWTLADARKIGRAILVSDRYPSPGWWAVHGDVMRFDEARRALAQAGHPHPGALAALLDLEPEAVALAGLLPDPRPRPAALAMQLAQARDPGATLATHCSYKLGDVASGKAPSPVLRAYAENPRVSDGRAQQIAVISQALASGEANSAEEMGRWVASPGLQRQIDEAGDHLRQGKYVDASQALKAIVSAESDTVAEEHPLVRRALKLAAGADIQQGERMRAEGTLRRALALEGRIAGVDREPFASLVLGFASVLVRTGRARDAEVLLHKLLGPAAPEPFPGQDPFESAAHKLSTTGSPDADEYLQLFLALPKLPPLSEEQRAEARRLLAEAWITQERYDEAEPLLQRAVEQADNTLPPDYPERWRTLAAYGRVLYFQGRPDEAEVPLRRALSLAEKHAGKLHPDTGRVLAELARVEHRLDRPEAPATAKRALAVLEAAQIAGTEKELARGELAPIAAVAR